MKLRLKTKPITVCTRIHGALCVHGDGTGFQHFIEFSESKHRQAARHQRPETPRCHLDASRSFHLIRKRRCACPMRSKSIPSAASAFSVR